MGRFAKLGDQQGLKLERPMGFELTTFSLGNCGGEDWTCPDNCGQERTNEGDGAVSDDSRTSTYDENPDM